MFKSVDICCVGGDIFRDVPITGAPAMTGSGCGYSTQSSGDFKLAIDEGADLNLQTRYDNWRPPDNTVPSGPPA